MRRMIDKKSLFKNIIDDHISHLVNKSIIMGVVYVFSFFVCDAQVEYGYDRPKSSTDPWKFGVNVSATYDWINQPNDIDKTWGYKAGFSFEKHLVYNVYFRPVINLWEKGYDGYFEIANEVPYFDSIRNVDDTMLITNKYKRELRGYFLDIELNIELKFGSEEYGRGLVLSLTPFFTYGIGGKTTDKLIDAKDINSNLSGKYNTFSDGFIKKEDVGLMFGVGYDINHHWELNFNYVMGYYNIGSYNNYRWRSLQFGLTYFINKGKLSFH